MKLNNFKNAVNSDLFKKYLNESLESSSISKAKKYLVTTREYSEEQADNAIRIHLRQRYPMLSSKIGGKYIYGVTRIYHECLTTSADALMLGRIANYIIKHDDEYQKYDLNFNGLDFNALYNEFYPKIKLENLDHKNKSAEFKLGHNKSTHILVPISHINLINYFKKYTPWCICDYEQTCGIIKQLQSLKEQHINRIEQLLNDPDKLNDTISQSSLKLPKKVIVDSYKQLILECKDLDLNKIPINAYVLYYLYCINIEAPDVPGYFYRLLDMCHKHPVCNKLFILVDTNYKNILRPDHPAINDKFGTSLIAVIANRDSDNSPYDIYSSTSRYNGTIRDDAHSAFNEYELSLLLGMPLQKAIKLGEDAIKKYRPDNNSFEDTMNTVLKFKEDILQYV